MRVYVNSTMNDEEVLQKLEKETCNAKQLQLETLRTILEHNASVHYLQIHDLAGKTDPVSFKRSVPISSYSDYLPYIEKIADGDSSPFLSTDPLVCFFYSSGTSSLQPKMIPYFDSQHSKSSSNFARQVSAATIRRLFPRRPIYKILWFLSAGNVIETKGGIKVMAATAFPMRSTSPSTSPLFSVCNSPPQIFFGLDPQQQLYCHLLCGLRNSCSIDGIRAPYAAALVRALRLLESKWEQLCEDIESGSVYPGISDIAMRDAVLEFLDGPDPNTAKRIREVCKGRDWGGILAKLWPNLRYVSCVTTGSMEQYYPELKHYTGHLPLLGGDYYASECSIAVNMDRTQRPESTRFVMLPTTAYFEFLPFTLDSSINIAAETVDFCDVEIGKMYEVVVTTFKGLYRYRLGDIVKVVGFHNSSPELEFVTRAPGSPSDIITERDLLSAIESLRPMLRVESQLEIMEFTSFLELESTPRHIVIFMEVSKGCEFLQKEGLHELVPVLRRCCSFLDDLLGNIYKMQRISGNLGPLELSVVKSGSFDRILEVALENGTIASQYKPPKILRNKKIIDLLRASSLFSTYP